MAYQVLARKWRPKNFKEMVGQEHVLRALINALDEDRLHHAYLFTGTRGVGKTTIARIIAKSLNCETAGVSSMPCGQCSACTEIDEGRFVDLIEVDAASRTKVEDTRELLENVQYAPTRGRYKVYLIDEVHMLSTSSFNALLKTLEEPPPHVKFLLATTDPQKLPATVLSRCLQFSLKRMPLDTIVSHHQNILGQEGINFEEAALKHIARAADGSMRDSLSLLDQAIAFGHGQVRTDDVVAMLGFISKDHVQRMLTAVATQDANGLMDAINQLAELAPDYSTVLNDLIMVLHQLALAKQLPDAIDESLMDKSVIIGLAEQFSPEAIQLHYQIALMGKKDLPLVPDPRQGLEMIMLRMLAFKPADYTVNVTTTVAPASAPQPSGQPDFSAARAALGGAQGGAAKKPDSAEQENLTVPAAKEHAPEAESVVITEAQVVSAAPEVLVEPAIKEQPEVAVQASADKPRVQETKPAVFDLSAAFLSQQQSKAEEVPTQEKPVQAAPKPVEINLETIPQTETTAENIEKPQEIAQQSVQPAVVPQPAQHAEPIQQTKPAEQAPQPQPARLDEPPIEAYFDDMPPMGDDVPPPWHQDEAMASASPSQPVAPAVQASTPTAPQTLVQAPSPEPQVAQAVPVQETQKVHVEGAYAVEEWVKIIDKLDITGFVGELARNSVLVSNEKGIAQLLLSPSAASMNTPANIDRMQAALGDYFQRPIKLDVVIGESDIETPTQQTIRHDGERQQGAVDSILHDPLVQQFQQHFGARVIQEAIRPITAQPE